MIKSTPSSLIPDASNDTYQGKARRIILKTTGLKPLTKHDVYFDGILYNFATKPYGGNIGDPLISDNGGYIQFESLYEHPFEGSYSYEGIVDKSKLDGGSSSRFNKTYMFIELKGPDSYASFNYPKRIYVVSTHVNRQETHGH